MSLEVRLELALSTDVTSGTMERTSERKEVSEGNRHHLEAPLLEGLDSGSLVSLHNHTIL